MSKEKVKDFSKLLFGNIGAQIVAVGLYPYISRFYTPSDFSNFGFVVSLTMFLSVFATGQFHMALFNPETEEEYKQVVGIGTTFIFLTSFLVLLYFWFFNKTLMVVAFYLFFYSLFELAKLVFVKRKEFSSSAFSQVAYRLGGNGFKLFPYFANQGYLGLTIAEILSLVLVVAFAFKKKAFNFNFNFSILKKYSKFPLIHSFTVAISILISDFPIIFWFQKYSSENIGYFVMAQKLLVTPALVFSNAVQNISVHQFIKSAEQFSFYFNLVLKLIVLGLAGTLIFSWIGIGLFTIVLGPKWIGGDPVYNILSYLFITKLALSVAQATFVIKNDIKTPFILRLLQFFILYLGVGDKFSFYQALKFYVVLDVTFDLILIIRGAFLLKKVSYQTRI